MIPPGYAPGDYGSYYSTGAINAVLDIKEEEPLYGYDVIEPVSLSEQKSYMKIDFDDDDDLIQTFITASREQIEKYTGLSLIQKRITAQLNNGDSGIEIPYGPTPDEIDVTLITDVNGDPFNDSEIVITGNQFKTIQSPITPFLQIIYSAGYSTVPAALKVAIMAQCFFLYENRGEKLSASNGGGSTKDFYIADAAIQAAKKYKRNNELSL